MNFDLFFSTVYVQYVCVWVEGVGVGVDVLSS